MFLMKRSIATAMKESEERGSQYMVYNGQSVACSLTSTMGAYSTGDFFTTHQWFDNIAQIVQHITFFIILNSAEHEEALFALDTSSL